MSENFRKDLIEFLVKASKQDENYYGYINPWLLADILNTLTETTTNAEDEIEGLIDWANKYWSW